MFNFFKKQPGTGAILDTRTELEKSKDFKFEEIVAKTAIVSWSEKPQEAWRKFPIFSQNGSGSCVAQTLSKLMGIMYWLKNGVYVHFSSAHIYQRRSNKPSAGMSGIEVFQIGQQGVTLEELAPSQNMTDAQMDAVEVQDYKQKVGEIFKLGNYIVLPVSDIETVASVIQTTGKGVMIWTFWEYDEWTTVPYLKYPELLLSNATGVHSTASVDFTMYDGEKAIIIDDSWGSSYGKAGQRVIKESFFKKRNIFAAYPMNFKFDAITIQKPVHTFTKTLVFSPVFKVDNDVKALQDILKFESLFPTNTDSTGYYGALTSKAVMAFQKKYQIANDVIINELAGKQVGPATIKKLNELYSK